MLHAALATGDSLFSKYRWNSSHSTPRYIQLPLPPFFHQIVDLSHQCYRFQCMCCMLLPIADVGFYVFECLKRWYVFLLWYIIFICLLFSLLLPLGNMVRLLETYIFKLFCSFPIICFVVWIKRGDFYKQNVVCRKLEQKWMNVHIWNFSNLR